MGDNDIPNKMRDFCSLLQRTFSEIYSEIQSNAVDIILTRTINGYSASERTLRAAEIRMIKGLKDYQITLRISSYLTRLL
jgi:hypothetical protein